MLTPSLARSRRALIALFVVALVGAASMSMRAAGAVTSSAPAANVSLTIVGSTTNLSPTSATPITFHADTSNGTTLNGSITSRICSDGPLITNSGDFGFQTGTRCVKPGGIFAQTGFTGADFTKGQGNFSGVTGSGNLTHNVAVGTADWQNDALDVGHVECSSTSPCNLVVAVNINTAPGTVYFTQQLTFLAPPAVPTAPQNLQAVAGNGQVNVSWDRLTSANPVVTSYDVVATPTSPAGPALPAVNVPDPGTGTSVSTVLTLTNGTTYDITVTANNGLGAGPASAPVSATPQAPNRFIFQQINVTRPNGALVLTQECASPAPVPGSYIYPDENAPIGDVTDVVYPTSCTVDLGTATLVKSGTYSGQYFNAQGTLREITIVDTRHTDDGWVVNGVLTGTGNFRTGAGPFVSGQNQFTGKNLGWSPVAPTVTPPIAANDGDPAYAQAASAGAAVAPVTGGLKSTRPLATAASGHGLGIARLNAGLSVMIPVFNFPGVYTAQLQITAI